jgi:hypothetical protein
MSRARRPQWARTTTVLSLTLGAALAAPALAADEGEALTAPTVAAAAQPAQTPYNPALEGRIRRAHTGSVVYTVVGGLAAASSLSGLAVAGMSAAACSPYIRCTGGVVFGGVWAAGTGIGSYFAFKQGSALRADVRDMEGVALRVHPVIRPGTDGSYALAFSGSF